MSPNLLDALQHHRPDLAGARYVRAATGAAVDVIDRDDPQLAASSRRFPQSCLVGCRSIFERDSHRARFTDNRIRLALQLGELSIGGGRRVEFDGGMHYAKMHARCFPLEAISGERREKMLCRMLLHVIAAARTMDGATHCTERHSALHDMDDSRIFVDHINDTRRAEDTEIVWLSTRCRIERGTIKYHMLRIARVLDHLRIELKEQCIAIVQALGHINSTLSPT